MYLYNLSDLKLLLPLQKNKKKLLLRLQKKKKLLLPSQFFKKKSWDIKYIKNLKN